MTQANSHIELAYSSIRVFADDGTLDMEELNFLLGIALKDGEIDADERRVLQNIFKQARTCQLADAVLAKIKATEEKYGL